MCESTVKASSIHFKWLLPELKMVIDQQISILRKKNGSLSLSITEEPKLILCHVK